MEKLKWITRTALAGLALIAACGEPECPSYLRTEGADCVAPGPADAGAKAPGEREAPQRSLMDASVTTATQAPSEGQQVGGREASRDDAGESPASTAGGAAGAAGAGGMSAMESAGRGAPNMAMCGNGVGEGTELCDDTDCPTECKQNSNTCLVAKLEGHAATCDAQCIETEIMQCIPNDDCCPKGCDHGTDSDCSPSCGDGVLSGAEKCEDKSADHPCPTAVDCDDDDPCTSDIVTGSATQCSAQCAHMPVTRELVDCDDGDPCTDDEAVESATSCSYECTHSAPRQPTGSCEDSDPCTDDTPQLSSSRCAYECPHRREQPSAANCDDGDPCTDDTPAMSATRCAYECPHNLEPADTECGNGMMCNASGRCEAPPARCGDGVLTAPEECDPASPGQVAGYSCNTSCRRLNKLTPCNSDSQCEASPAGKCDIPGMCRPHCTTEGTMCEILPGATRNESTCTNGGCAWLCNVYEGVDAEHCGPRLWCDGTYCRVKP